MYTYEQPNERLDAGLLLGSSWLALHGATGKYLCMYVCMYVCI